MTSQTIYSDTVTAKGEPSERRNGNGAHASTDAGTNIERSDAATAPTVAHGPYGHLADLCRKLDANLMRYVLGPETATDQEMQPVERETRYLAAAVYVKARASSPDIDGTPLAALQDPELNLWEGGFDEYYRRPKEHPLVQRARQTIRHLLLEIESQRQQGSKMEVPSKEAPLAIPRIFDEFDLRILRCLASVSVPLRSPEIREKAPPKMGQDTVKRVLRRLEADGLVNRPKGQRSGYMITDKGTNAYDRLEC